MYVEHWSENLVTSKRMNFKGEVTRDNKVPEQIGEDEVGNTGKGLLLLPSIFPRIRVFSNELALCIRWPKY